jgi:hypothetical protein
VAQPPEPLLAAWQQDSSIYLLVQNPAPFQASVEQTAELGQAADWYLLVNRP